MRHAVHAAFIVARELRELQPIRCRKVELSRVSADTGGFRRTEGLAQRWRRCRRFDGRIELHLEIEIVPIGEIELDRPASVDAFWSVELSILEVVARDRQVFVVARNRQVGVERDRRRHRGGGSGPGQLGVGERHRQIDLFCHRIDAAGRRRAHRSRQIYLGTRWAHERCWEIHVGKRIEVRRSGLSFWGWQVRHASVLERIEVERAGTFFRRGKVREGTAAKGGGKIREVSTRPRRRKVHLPGGRWQIGRRGVDRRARRRRDLRTESNLCRLSLRPFPRTRRGPTPALDGRAVGMHLKAFATLRAPHAKPIGGQTVLVHVVRRIT